ncbi:type II toxin-antitoxin system RelE/ParE family toxin [Candidatus Peregrinibacteria bacterium]|nr:type II toxin-antitoxin system RelE/ParE family toxin [Candidatus Peregrinibacteria bacterium]
MFELLIEKRAWKDIDKIDVQEQSRVLTKLQQILSENPYPRGGNPKKLMGEEAFRLRIGDYRVLYRVYKKQVFVFAVGHRKDVYR